METVAMARLVVAVSPDGQGDWKLLKPDEVPEWLRSPDVMGMVAAGNLAHDEADPDGPWYCAVQLTDPKPANEDLGESEASAILPAPTPRLITSGGIPVADS